jgi:Fe-S oxidoreductase
MAAYKAEFLSHHYEKRLRPLAAHVMGRIGQWAPLAAMLPGVFNRISPMGKRIAGIAAERRLPSLAPRSFRSDFNSNKKGERVVLFDDTFNNHFRPQTAQAAQRVLEAAGCAVELPASHVCCGRPYYDFGMLSQARSALARVLSVLDVDAPVVVLEPGCLSVFRKELGQLFPDDPLGESLSLAADDLGDVHVVELRP